MSEQFYAGIGAGVVLTLAALIGLAGMGGSRRGYSPEPPRGVPKLPSPPPPPPGPAPLRIEITTRGGDTRMEVKFAFAIGQKVKHKNFPVAGVVTGLMVYSKNVARVGISYLATDGKIVDDWFDEDQLEAA